MDPVGIDTEYHPALQSVWQRIAASLLEMAIIAGIVVRVLHVVANAHGQQLDWHSFVGTFIAIPVILLALATIHLASYPLHQWAWRAPAFALVESAVESVLSLLLILAGRERWGTGRAVLGDWPAMSATTLLSRVGMICLFALVLGGVAQYVRRREIHAERERSQHAEPDAAGHTDHNGHTAPATESPAAPAPPASPDSTLSQDRTEDIERDGGD